VSNDDTFFEVHKECLLHCGKEQTGWSDNEIKLDSDFINNEYKKCLLYKKFSWTIRTY